MTSGELACLERGQAEQHALFVVDEALAVEAAERFHGQLVRTVGAGHDRDRHPDQRRQLRHREVEDLEADGLDFVDECQRPVVVTREGLSEDQRTHRLKLPPWITESAKHFNCFTCLVHGGLGVAGPDGDVREQDVHHGAGPAIPELSRFLLHADGQIA